VKRRRRVTLDQSLKECRDAAFGGGGLDPFQEIFGVFVIGVWYWIVGVPVQKDVSDDG
jgi:hypothetical protein